MTCRTFPVLLFRRFHGEDLSGEAVHHGELAGIRHRHPAAHFLLRQSLRRAALKGQGVATSRFNHERCVCDEVTGSDDLGTALARPVFNLANLLNLS